MYVTGQSNASGSCSANSGYRLSDSVVCAAGEVYSTYVSTTPSSDSIAGVSFSEHCTADNASKFVAGSLRGNESISGNLLEYKLEALTSDGAGKTGPDSGLAYEWNRLTDDKVWVVNTAWGGSSINTWIPGGASYKTSMAVNKLVQQTYQAEIEAGHYVEGERLAFWLQGEADKSKTAESYYTSFKKLYHAMADGLNLDAFGIIMVRSNEGSQVNAEDISMSGPRIAQYAAGNSKELSKVHVVSNANEQWVTNDMVKSYFAKAYPEGYLAYPTRSALYQLPTSVSEIHSDIHYSQIGHNENGITAAKGMYMALYHSGQEEVKVIWKNKDGEEINDLTVGVDETKVAVPVMEPVWLAKQTDYEIDGTGVSFNITSGTVTGKKEGTVTIRTRDAAGHEVAAFPVTVKNVGVPILTDTTTAQSGIKVNWKAVGGASGYAVYRKVPGGSWKMIDTTTATSYLDTTGIENGTSYYYTIRAYKGDVTTAKKNKYNTKYWSGYDPTGIPGAYYATPVLSKATASAAGTTISWGKVKGASGYAVYRKGPGGSWTTIATTTGTSYTDTAVLTNGKTYSYTVRAYVGDLSTAQSHKYKSNYWSYYDTTGVKSVYLDNPALTGTTTAGKGIKVSWEKVEGASGYAVYRKTASTNWAMIATTTGASYTDKSGMKNGLEYYYTVRAYAGKLATAKSKKYDARYWSGYDPTGIPGAYYATPALSKATASAAGTTVSWGKVKGVSGYTVYRKGPGGSWTTIATTTGTSYTDTAVLTNGKTYSYTVRAYVGDLSTAQSHKYKSNYWSYYDTTGVKSVYLDNPALTGTTTAGKGIKVSWEKVEGASGYAVYRKTASTNWAMIATTTGASYTDKSGMKNGLEYYYTVRAYAGKLATAKSKKYDAGYWSGYDSSGVQGRFITAPHISGEKASATGRTITWEKVKGASGYAIYRKVSGGTWAMIDLTTEASYTDEARLTNGKTYYYTVRAYVGNAEEALDNKYTAIYWSYYDTAGAKTVYIPVPELTEVVRTDSGIRVTWNSVKGAEGYAVYRKASGDNWGMIGTTTSASYVDKSADQNIYSYTVRAYRGDVKTAKANKYSSVYWSGYGSGGSVN